LIYRRTTQAILPHNSFGKNNDDVIILDQVMIAMKPVLVLYQIANPVALNDDYTQIGKLSKRHVLQNQNDNHPHNPTGKILSESDFEALETYWKKS
jgi:methionine aminotransferase